MAEVAPQDARIQSGNVASLLRGLAVLEALVQRRGACSPREIAEATNLDRSIVQRALHTLVAAGYVQRLAHGDYRIGPGAVALGWRLTQGQGFGDMAMHVLEKLRNETRETVNMAMLDNVDIVYVGRVESGKLVTVNVPVGTRVPAWCTALGRAMLAYLPRDRARSILEQSDRRKFTERTHVSVEEIEAELVRVRSLGYALVDQELEENIRSIAAPVFDADSRSIAAINIACTAGRPLKALRAYAPVLVNAAREVSASFGWRGA